MNIVRRDCRGLALAFLAILLSAGASRPAPALVDNVVYNPATGHWYKHVLGTGTWAQSKAGAQAIGGYLAAFSDLAEIQWTLANLAMGTSPVWIGGSDNGSEGTWYWSNGEPWNYTNWNSGEPNNVNVEDYLVMYTVTTSTAYAGSWNDYNGSSSLTGYVVEWNADPNAPPPPVAPPAPTDLTAVLSFRGTIVLEWTDNSAIESTYQVQRMTAGGAFDALATLGIDAATHEDLDLVPLATYTYRVRAVNAVGPSDWSNEATAASGPFAPSTPAPADLVVSDTTAGTADLSWTDRSNGEIGFEIQRRESGGVFAFRFRTAPDVVTFHDTGIAPDTVYDYAVRSVGTVRASEFIEASGTTDPTLVVASVKGDLKDSPKFARDSLKATAGWTPIDGVSDAAADPVEEGITVRAGNIAAPMVLTLPPGTAGWKGKGAKWKWKSLSGTSPKYRVRVDLEKRLVTVSAVGLELAAAPANPVKFSVAIGNDAGTEIRDWVPQEKPGYLKLRQGNPPRIWPR